MGAMNAVDTISRDVLWLAGVVGLETVTRLLTAVMDGDTAGAMRAAGDAADLVTEAGCNREQREMDRYWSMQPGYGLLIR